MLTKKGVFIPDDLAEVLNADEKVLAVFETMRPSCQKTYVKWITEAKRTQTGERRLQKVREMVLDYGKRHAR